MAASDFRDKYAIVGIGMTPTSRTHAPPGMSGLMLEAWGAKLAIEDAGLRREDIDGTIHATLASPHPPAQWIDSYSRTLGLKPNFYLSVARGGQAAHNGILLATQMLSMELANYVIVSYGRPATLDDYMHSPFVIEPIRRMDCCVQSDLGVAIIVTTAERARALKRPPVYVKGIGQGDQARDQWW